MKQIARDTYEAMQKSHPIEGMIWKHWVTTGQAQVADRLRRS